MKGLTLDRLASLALPMDLVTLRGYLSMPATAARTAQTNRTQSANKARLTRCAHSARLTDSVAELLAISALVLSLDDDSLPSCVPACEQDADQIGRPPCRERGCRYG